MLDLHATERDLATTLEQIGRDIAQIAQSLAVIDGRIDRVYLSLNPRHEIWSGVRELR